MGQMSWVLSCTYEQVLGYPARIVNDFARGLGLGLRGMLTTNRIVRIHPSVEALQVALSYADYISALLRGWGYISALLRGLYLPIFPYISLHLPISP